MMPVVLYRTYGNKVGVIEPVEVDCATANCVWLRGYKMPRHREEVERYWDTEAEAANYWVSWAQTRLNEAEKSVEIAKKCLDMIRLQYGVSDWRDVVTEPVRVH